jgi:hypothetical protein
VVASRPTRPATKPPPGHTISKIFKLQLDAKSSWDVFTHASYSSCIIYKNLIIRTRLDVEIDLMVSTFALDDDRFTQDAYCSAVQVG